MRHPRRLVLTGCLSALIVMTILLDVVGLAAPNLMSHNLTHHVATLQFFGFELWSLWDNFHQQGDAEELDEVEKKLDADFKGAKGTSKDKAFSITFFGEWGDKRQLATIGLAANENRLGVVLGGILGQTLCTVAAVMGGKSLASQISERVIHNKGSNHTYYDM